ncbi:MAG: pro-sigmaK processing inhibitor BofA family protein [Bacilli bacterium]|nr:pro-sigmaK processing inhibitor BofA family protein [Bacilli bacterium]
MIEKNIKKIILSFFLLYWFNNIGVNFNLIIPINIVTILLITLLDIPGLALLSISLIVLF